MDISVKKKVKQMKKKEVEEKKEVVPKKDEGAPQKLPDKKGDISLEKPKVKVKSKLIEDTQHTQKRKTKRKKAKKSVKNEQLESEKQLYEAERYATTTTHTPQTPDAFDRLLLQSPNSSVIWLRYMAHHLESSDIAKARVVAERALKTIAFREEQEKLNVWLGWLSMESMYGTPDSMTDLLHRAVRYNEPWKVYSHMLSVYTQADKTTEAEELLMTMLKKFKQDKRVWLEAAMFYYKEGKPETARGLLQRGLKSLDKTLHIEVISKFSRLECQHGQLEVGKSMFEQLLGTYPKRSDLWSVYIDILVKAGLTTDARAIFERLTRMKLPNKKMKFFFKKYVDFERQHGTPDGVKNVMQKAVDYVDQS